MTDKSKQLEKALGDIRKRYGDEAIMYLGSKPKLTGNVISTGSLGLDLAIGVGGLPRGRVVEIYGPESSGKSTLCQHIVAEAQKAGLSAVYIDMEHALDPSYAEAIGVIIDELIVSQPSSGEEALEITEALIRSGAADVVVVDSVAALVPQKELEGDMGDAVMGQQARLMSQAMRKLNAIISKSNTLVIFVNQLRMKLGVLFGNPETTTGGNALKFYASVRLDVRRTGTNKKGDQAISNTVKVKVVKNKVAPPFKSCSFDITYGVGIDKIEELLSMGDRLGVVTKRGAFYSYGETRLGQGKAASVQFLKENPILLAEIDEKIRHMVLTGEVSLQPDMEENEPID